MRPPGAPDQLEQRRRRAVQLLQAGRPTSAVARQVQASVSSVWRWWQTYQHRVAPIKAVGTQRRPKARKKRARLKSQNDDDIDW
jgi:transposase